MAIPNVVCRIWSLIASSVIRLGDVAFPLSGLFFILYIIFYDECLSRHFIASISLCAVYFFTCCLLILSRICVLRRKSYAKNVAVELMWDTDLTLLNETEEVVYYKLSWQLKYLKHTLKSLFFKNPREFSKFRPVYGMVLVTGLALGLLFSLAIIRVNQWNTDDDMHCVAMVLAFPMTLLIGGFYFISNAGIYFATKKVDFYVPFEEHVQIPVKVLVGKAVAAFLTAGRTHGVLVSFIIILIALSIISSNYIYQTSDMENTLQSILPIFFPDARKLATTFLVTSCMACVNLLVGLVLTSFVFAKHSIIGIIETNWRRNFVAIEFLLPNIKMENLEELKDALKIKRQQQLTKQEQDAFRYIDFPIWRTKQPFRGRWVSARTVPNVQPQDQPEINEQEHLRQEDQFAILEERYAGLQREVSEPEEEQQVEVQLPRRSSRIQRRTELAPSMNLRSRKVPQTRS